MKNTDWSTRFEKSKIEKLLNELLARYITVNYLLFDKLKVN